MEDILSSIKRIIAEDSDQTLSAPRTKRSVGLTVAEPAPATDDEEHEVLELTDAVADAPAPHIDTPASSAPRPAPPKIAERPGSKPELASATTVEASRSSLATLSALIVKPEVQGGDTLEGLVREMLRPMLAEWLDARLPDIVDRLVKQEIARISAHG